MSGKQRFVYKVCTVADWRAATDHGTYLGSADDRRDNFIHLSTADQLAGTLARRFNRQPNLVLIAFDAAMLGDQLKWEPSRGGQLFPHMYRPLEISLALRVDVIPVGTDGVHILPAKLYEDLR